MTNLSSFGKDWTSPKYLGLGVLSVGLLYFEVVLTRVFALAQGYHFAFMAVSLALLGAGASGTFLFVRPVAQREGARWLAASALLFSLSVPGSYLVVNTLPFDAYRIAYEPAQLIWLVVYYVILSVPFFFGGLAVGVSLVSWPQEANRLYAANLIGSGLGPPLALLSLDLVGGPGSVFGVALLGCVAFMILTWTGYGKVGPKVTRATGALLGAAWLAMLLFPPAVASIRLTPYQALSQALLYPGSRVVEQVWNSFSRIDVVQSQGIRSAPGLSMAYRGSPPMQLGLTVDGQNLSPITPVAASEADFSAYLPITLAFLLRPQADVLIVEPGGGLAVLAALHSDARRVTVIHSNPDVARAVGMWGAGLYDDPRVRVVVDETRSFLRRETGKYDLILLPVTDSFRPVTAGAYALGEDYRYSLETVAELWEHLTPDGLLVAERWLQLPPSESLRLWGIVVESAVKTGIVHPARHLAVVRSLQTSLIVGSRAPLTELTLTRIGDFVASRQYDLVWSPDLMDWLSNPGQIDEETLQTRGVNRFNRVIKAPYFTTFARLLSAVETGPRETKAFFSGYEYAVEPSTDDHPFFFHFFKWRQIPKILTGIGKTWQPFGGTGYLVLSLLLVVVLLLSAGLILLPLVLVENRRPERESGVEGVADARIQPAGRYLAYFSFIGLGFLMVEMPLLQRFIVFLGQPAYAFATVVGALLITSGLGSRYLSRRIPRGRGLLGLVALVLAYPVILPGLFGITFGLPFAGRVVVSVLALAPLGLLMGLPFPQGLDLVHRQAPRLLPWTWAVNGCASVVSAVLAPMLALDLGFGAVLLVGAGAYAGAGFALRWARDTAA